MLRAHPPPSIWFLLRAVQTLSSILPRSEVPSWPLHELPPSILQHTLSSILPRIEVRGACARPCPPLNELRSVLPRSEIGSCAAAHPVPAPGHERSARVCDRLTVTLLLTVTMLRGALRSRGSRGSMGGDMLTRRPP